MTKLDLDEELDKILDWNDHTLPYDQQRSRAKKAIQQLIDKEVEKTHALYPDKEKYYAKEYVEQLLKDREKEAQALGFKQGWDERGEIEAKKKSSLTSPNSREEENG